MWRVLFGEEGNSSVHATPIDKEKKQTMRRYRAGFRYVFPIFLAFQLMFFASISPVAHAGGTIKIDNTHSVSIGMGLRSSFNLVEDGAQDGSSYSKDFLLDNIRLYMGGDLGERITFEFNTDYSKGAFVTGVGPTTTAGTEDIRVLDAVVKVAFSDIFNVWAGRFLPPSDRSNLSGPYFLNAWDFPFVQKYPAVFAGRDDGLSIWGQVNGGQFKYQVGAFEGSGDVAGGSNQKDSLLYAGRLTLNLWDPEPGYYNSSSYYGEKDVLAIGLVGMFQSDGSGTSATSGDFTGFNIDFLAEKDLGGSGVATLEGAYYDYDRDGVATGEGNGFFALASFLLPNKLGSGPLQGQLQPMVRYQEFSNEGNATGDHTRLDLALSHIINGHNARLTLTYSMDESAANVDTDTIKFGFQFQI